jgi:hypothetical protein
MGGANQKVLSSRPHGEAPIDAPWGLRGPHRFWALADDFAEECPDAAGVSRDASEANPPAGQARDAPLGRRLRGAGPAEPETDALHHPAGASVRPDSGRRERSRVRGGRSDGGRHRVRAGRPEPRSGRTRASGGALPGRPVGRHQPGLSPVRRVAACRAGAPARTRPRGVGQAGRAPNEARGHGAGD